MFCNWPLLGQSIMSASNCFILPESEHSEATEQNNNLSKMDEWREHWFGVAGALPALDRFFPSSMTPSFCSHQRRAVSVTLFSCNFAMSFKHAHFDWRTWSVGRHTVPIELTMWKQFSGVCSSIPISVKLEAGPRPSFEVIYLTWSQWRYSKSGFYWWVMPSIGVLNWVVKTFGQYQKGESSSQVSRIYIENYFFYIRPKGHWFNSRLVLASLFGQCFWFVVDV